MVKISNLCVFCSARLGKNFQYAHEAELFGQSAAKYGLNIIYGGGHVGLMGKLADGALSEGGRVIGIIPNFMVENELAHQKVELEFVDSMHARKARMAELADAFVALPGGFGTLDELNEIITWRQLGLHQKPIFLINTFGYYNDFLLFLKRAVYDGFISQTDLDHIQVFDNMSSFFANLN